MRIENLQDVRGVAILHNAPSALIATLRSLTGSGPASKFAILGRETSPRTRPLRLSPTGSSAPTSAPRTANS